MARTRLNWHMTWKLSKGAQSRFLLNNRWKDMMFNHWIIRTCWSWLITAKELLFALKQTKRKMSIYTLLFSWQKEKPSSTSSPKYEAILFQSIKQQCSWSRFFLALWQFIRLGCVIEIWHVRTFIWTNTIKSKLLILIWLRHWVVMI